MTRIPEHWRDLVGWVAVLALGVLTVLGSLERWIDGR